eukprot:m.788012 g.788012  ORF g.788012 m.788012 type:complete len:284 (-) comp23311_c0_seq2:2012-2863(-)
MQEQSLADETCWECSRCTLLNSIGLEDPYTARCEACGSLRRHDPPAEQHDFSRSGLHRQESIPQRESLERSNSSSRSQSQKARKILYLMRGLPGSGKSTLAKTLGGKILSADHFFTGRDGKYNYDPKLAWRAHLKCQSRTKEHMEHEIPVIIVDNTNVEKKDMVPYVRLACEYGYWVKLREPDTPWKFDVKILAEKNTHNVELDTIARMLQRYQKDIKAKDLVQAVKAKMQRAAALSATSGEHTSAHGCVQIELLFIQRGSVSAVHATADNYHVGNFPHTCVQ